MNNINLVDFVTDVLDIHLLPYQKYYFNTIQNLKEEPEILCARDEIDDIFFFAWTYKKMWENYLETGEVKFPFDLDDNSESLRKEYMCEWSGKNESN